MHPIHEAMETMDSLDFEQCKSLRETRKCKTCKAWFSTKHKHDECDYCGRRMGKFICVGCKGRFGGGNGAQRCPACWHEHRYPKCNIVHIEGSVEDED